MLGSLFGKLGDTWKCCGSIVLKRKQGLSEEKVQNAPGEIVDVIPSALESYAFRLLMKRLASSTDKTFYICGDGDMTVQIKQLSSSYQEVIKHLSSRYQNHIIWTISYESYDMILTSHHLFPLNINNHFLCYRLTLTSKP